MRKKNINLHGLVIFSSFRGEGILARNFAEQIAFKKYSICVKMPDNTYLVSNSY